MKQEVDGAMERIAPISLEETDQATRELLDLAGSRRDLRITRTVAHHSRIFKRWLPYEEVLLRGVLPARDRELLILRTAHHNGSPYLERAHRHNAASRSLSEAECENLTKRLDQGDWAPAEYGLLRAADELVSSFSMNDNTWAALAERYDVPQLLEITMVVGYFFCLGALLNSLGTPPELPPEGFIGSSSADRAGGDTIRAPSESTAPRIEPLAPSDQSEEARELLGMVGPFAHYHLFTTVVRHPALFKAWVPFGTAMLYGHLSARDRELIVLAAAYRTGCIYESSQHESVATDAGVSPEEIARLRGDASTRGGWSADDGALVDAVREFIDEHRVSDQTWTTLAATHDDKLLVEILMVITHYCSLAFTLNGIRIEPESQAPPTIVELGSTRS